MNLEDSTRSQSGGRSCRLDTTGACYASLRKVIAGGMCSVRLQKMLRKQLLFPPRLRQTAIKVAERACTGDHGRTFQSTSRPELERVTIRPVTRRLRCVALSVRFGSKLRSLLRSSTSTLQEFAMAIELSGKWIVELEPGVYFDACCAGDPPRTVVRKFARQYKTESGALRGLRWCQRFRPFMNGKVVRVDDTATQARRAAFNKLVPPMS